MKSTKLKLSEYCPEVKIFWDPDLNGSLSFEEAECFKQDYFEFRCDKNPKHIFSRRVDKLYDRNGDLTGCKYCGKGAKEAFPGENDLITVCKEAADEWDYEKNKDVDPTHILPGSQKKCWFTCKNGHSNLRKVKDFVNYPVCPDCAMIDQSLPSIYPEILNIWDKRKNSIDPFTVYKTYRTETFFKCPKCGFEWSRTATNYLTAKFCGVCGYDGTDGSEERNREYIRSHPVITFRMDNPKAAKMWDYENNDPDKTPDSLLAWSNYKAAFLCDKGHRFTSKINELHNKKREPLGCPYCEGRAIITGENDFFTLCKEARNMWDYEANAGIDPTKLPTNSIVYAYFKCEHGHTFKKHIRDFFRSPGCTTCVRSVGEHSEMLRFWDFDKNAIDPWNVNADAGTPLVHWKCKDCGYEWDQTPRNRLSKAGLCAGCGVQKKSMPTDKSKLTFDRYNPGAAKLWIKARNTGVTPESVTGTSDEYITMGCENDPRHIYDIQISKIPTKPPYGCPYCNKRKVLPGEDLFSVCKEAKEMWDPDNTGFDDLTLIKPWSYQKAGFICNNGHRFTRSIAGFVKNRRCPKCHKTSRIEETVVDIPHLIRQWDYAANTKDPAKIYARSRETAFWKCEKCGYTWSSRINSRFASKGECPACETKIVVVPGKNDLFSLVPELKKYYDYEKNKDIDINYLSVTTLTPCYWKCPDCGYEWSASPTSRIKGSREEGYQIVACASCSGAVRTISYGEEYPDLLEMYEPSNSTPLTEIVGSSALATEFSWKCKTCGEVFRSSLGAMIRSRSSQYRGCTYCAGKSVSKGKSFAELFPDLMDEYDPENVIDAYSVPSKSGQEVNWICRNNNAHRWSATFNARAKGIGTCPVCKDYNRGRRVIDLFPEFEKYYDAEKNERPFFTLGPHTRLKCFWKCEQGHEFAEYITVFSKAKRFFCPVCENYRLQKGVNDLLSQEPGLAAEFDTEKNSISADEVMINSSDPNIWWRCAAKGHAFQRAVGYRINMYRDCPICTGTVIVADVNSLAATDPELAKEWSPNNERIASEVFKDAQISAYWICPICHGEYFRYLNEKQLGDDSCPYCYHGKALPGYNSLVDTDEDLAREWSKTNDRGPETVTKESNINALWTCPVCHGDYLYRVSLRQLGDDSCPYCNKGRALPGVNTLDITDADLAKEWSSANDRGPETVTKSMRMSVYWTCPNCRGDYPYHISDRKAGDDACPYCNKGKRLAGFNTLEVTDPVLAKEWSAVNIRGPETVTKDMRLSVYWTCPNCNGEYLYPIADREAGDDSCPYCNKGKRLAGFNTLEVTDPKLAEEWSSANSRGPETVTKNMRTNALWTCPVCHGDYLFPVADREVGDDSCPYCRNKRLLKGYNSFADRHDDLINEWDYMSNYLLCSPDEILDTYQKNVWWKCQICGRKYELSPKKKVLYQKRHMKSCTFCRGNRRKLKHYI